MAVKLHAVVFKIDGSNSRTDGEPDLQMTDEEVPTLFFSVDTQKSTRFFTFLKAQ